MPRLVKFFLGRAQRRCGRPDPFTLDATALAILCRHDWEGVRELRRAIFELAHLCSGRAHIYPQDLRGVISGAQPADAPETLMLEARLLTSPDAALLASSCRRCRTAPDFIAHLIVTAYEERSSRGLTHREIAREFATDPSLLWIVLSRSRRSVEHAPCAPSGTHESE